MKNFIIFFKTIVIFILLTSKAHAYIDPGIGSIILQGIIASIAAIGVFFSNLRNKVLESITKIKKYIFRDKKNDIKMIQPHLKMMLVKFFILRIEFLEQ